MLKNTTGLLVAALSLFGCQSVGVHSDQVSADSATQSQGIKFEVVGAAGSYTSAATIQSINFGIQRSKVKCSDLAGRADENTCFLKWAFNRSDPIRPFITVTVALLVNGRFKDTVFRRLVSPDTQPRGAFVREISEILATLRERASGRLSAS